MSVSHLKIPRVIRLLAQHGASALRFKVENGRYVKPMISNRIAAVARKRAIVDGTFGTFSPVTGGWLPEWDLPRKMGLIKPYKGNSRERSRPSRFEKITKAMASMPDKISKLEQEVNERKPVKDLKFHFKRMEQIFGDRADTKKETAMTKAASLKKKGGPKKK